MRELETVSRIIRVTHVFFAFLITKNAFKVNPGHEPDPEIRISGERNRKRVTKRPANPVFWVSKLNRLKRTIQTRLRFSTAIQTATTKKQFRRLSGTARGCEMANLDDSTSWIASLSTLVTGVSRSPCLDGRGRGLR
jgi:hypothetical protein